MTVIVQLSDLHFGMHRDRLVIPLLDALGGLAADLIVISGDLTHRGRAAQYRQARAFLAALPARWLAVSGNHDVPLFDLRHRLFKPFMRFRTQIGPDLSPRWQSEAAQVIGLNTTNPLRWQQGILREAELTSAIAALDPARLNVIAAHHPFQHRPQVDKSLMPGAGAALGTLAAGGADLVLSGHLHQWGAGPFMGQPPAPGLIQLQAGTALCDRPVEPNDFALIEGDRNGLTITRMLCPEGQDSFRPASEHRFARSDDGWRAVTE